MTFFHDIPLLPEDSILGLPILFAADPRPNKVNLGIGAYKTAEGTPLVLNCVRKAESLILQKQMNKEYFPIDGDPEFNKSTLQLIFGPESALLRTDHVFAAQTIGGSGALRVLGEFFTKLINRSIFLPQPSWPNHKTIFERAGFTVGSYPYFDFKTNSLDFKGMCAAIETIPAGSVFLMHACCHNPTGVDPTLEQWKELSVLIKKRKLIPFFDFSYQGFGDDLDTDAQAVRLFLRDGHEMAVEYSYSKNLGLYGERVGMLAVIASDQAVIPNIGSQIKTLIRGNYSSPPLHGARIVTTILKSTELAADWKAELKSMCERVKDMRMALVDALIAKGFDQNLSSVCQQHGFFSFMGLNTDQVMRLREENGIYIPFNGRINLAGLNSTNIEYVAESLLSVM